MIKQFQINQLCQPYCTDILILLILCFILFIYLIKSQLNSSVSVTTHTITSHMLTLTSLTAVHGEVRWLVSLESRLLHSRPIDLDSVWMRTLSNQHLMNSQCT